MYVNIHSLAFLSGELRGQILPESDQYLQANLLGSNEVPSISTEANGNLVAELDGNQLTVTGSLNDLEGDIAIDLAGKAHVHDAVAGRNGRISIILNLTADEDNRGAIFEASNNSFTLTDEQVRLLLSQGNYVNIHSSAFRSGELRGQVLPIARTYLGTNLSGANEIQPIVTSAVGNLQFEITGNQLVVTGGFSELEGDFDANLAGGSHLYVANAANNGDITILLNATVDADLRSGIYNAVDNTFTIDDTQRANLLSGDIYVNIHTITNAPGELRGQILRDDNAFPEASTITSLENEAIVINDNDANTPFEVTWSASTDPNSDLVVYTFQLSTDENFKNLLINNKVSTDLSFVSDNAAITSLLENEDLSDSDSVKLYHRVVASDGSVSTPSSIFTITLSNEVSTEDTLAGKFQENIEFSVYPNPTSDIFNIRNVSNISFNVNVEIFNLFGRSVYNSSSVLNNSIEIDISSLQAGIYLLKVIDNSSNTVTTERIVKR